MIEAVAVLDRLIHQRRRIFLEIVLHLVDLIQTLDIVRCIFPHREHGVPLLAIDFIAALDRPGLRVALFPDLGIGKRQLIHRLFRPLHRIIQAFSLFTAALYICLKLDTLFLECLSQFADRRVVLQDHVKINQREFDHPHVKQNRERDDQKYCPGKCRYFLFDCKCLPGLFDLFPHAVCHPSLFYNTAKAKP